jgi:hypothetical protein
MKSQVETYIQDMLLQLAGMADDVDSDWGPRIRTVLEPRSWARRPKSADVGEPRERRQS